MPTSLSHSREKLNAFQDHLDHMLIAQSARCINGILFNDKDVHFNT
jgi:hypothetical protein